MNYVLGARGRLGRAIATALPPNQIKIPDHSVYSEWWRDGAADLVSHYFGEPENCTSVVYVAAGLIDPNRSSDEHHRVNYKLARNVIEGATKQGFKVVTFGTVMEKVVRDKSSNPYFASKIRLGDFVDEFTAKSDLVLHVRIHTLFGGPPPDGFMFLGQIYHSLVSNSEFKMSPGTQLREYHHLDDEVAAILKLLECGVAGAIALSHGSQFMLKDIARYIFDAFRCSELLRVGALPGPRDDNYNEFFERPHALNGMVFRDTLPALVDYFRLCVTSSGRHLP